MRLKVKSSIFAAISALSLAAAARRKSKPQGLQEHTGPSASKVVMDLLDLNEASKEELMELDGLEASVAEKIIRMRPYRDHREAAQKLGAFYRLQPSTMKQAA